MELSKAERKDGGRPLQYCVINDLPSLIWVANLASIEMHPLLSLAEEPSRPTHLVFDLDPGPGAGLLDCVWAARTLRKFLEELELRSFPKSSGGKGIHVAVPLNTPVDFEAAKRFSRGVAEAMEKRFPERLVSNMRKELRKRKVLVDWSQNSAHKTTVCAYSLRAKEKPYAAAPLEWEELSDAERKKKPEALKFLPKELLQRVRKKGDLHAPVLTLKQKLPTI